MKKITKILLCLVSLGANFAYSQSTIYADTVLGVSSEWSVCPNNWSSCKILGAPDVYPNCGDLPGSWSFSWVNNTTTPHPREWIEIGYNTHYYVDSINVYQTNHSGLIDTIYFRDALTGTWNIVFSDTAIFNNNCDVFRLGMPTTLYMVDAVRLAMSGNYTSLWPEFDAVALIGGVAIPLPIELNNFNVTCYNGLPEIKWSTLTEINNDYFTIEKSGDALNWEIVTYIQGAGNSNQQLNYSYIDDSHYNNNQTAYYRLKQTDFDSNYEYFKIAAIRCEGASDTSPVIFPNPASNTITI